MTWYKNWFDSEYYHILYKNRNHNEAKNFIENLVSKLKLKDHKIIDIACGKGRHANFLNTLGFNVVGIDLSENSISHAKKFENKNLKFFVHDMRKVFSNNTFDIATNLFTSFGYFKNIKDEQKTILAIRNNLKKDGLLIFDFLNSKKTIANLVKKEHLEINNINFRINRSVIDNFIIKDIEIIDNGKTYNFQEKVHALDLYNFTELFEENEMKILQVFGNYNLEKFDALTSDRLILIVQK